MLDSRFREELCKKDLKQEEEKTTKDGRDGNIPIFQLFWENLARLSLSPSSAVMHVDVQDISCLGTDCVRL